MHTNSIEGRETHNRVLDGISARPERIILDWLAPRVPTAISPDHLTVLGLAGAVCVCAGAIASNFASGFLYLAIAGLFLNWVGDSLDGTVARYRKIERPRYGFFVDHLGDVASQVLIVVGLGLSPYLHFTTVLLALAAYLILTIYTLVKLHVSRTMQLTYFGIGPTEVRVLIGIGIVSAAFFKPIDFITPLGPLSIFDIVAIAISLFAVISALVMFVKDARELARLDPARNRTTREVTMITLETGGIRT